MPLPTILVAEPHRLVREGLAFALRKKLRIHILEAASSEAVLHVIYRTRPDALLLSRELPGMHLIELVRHLKAHHPEMQLIVMTPQTPEEQGQKPGEWSSGNDSLHKHSSLETLCTTLSALSKAGPSEPVEGVAGGPGSQTTYYRQATGRALTRRELEIVSRLVRGETSKVIAGELGLSVHTVAAHRASIFKKLHVQKTTALINYFSTRVRGLQQ